MKLIAVVAAAAVLNQTPLAACGSTRRVAGGANAFMYRFLSWNARITTSNLKFPEVNKCL